MNTTEARDFLIKNSKTSVQEQRIKRKQIVDCFKVFWRNNPTEEDFAMIIDGLVLFPEMIYFMHKHTKG